MDPLIFDNLKIEFLTVLNDTIERQDQILWKILVYYFLMKNKQLKKNQLSEIEDILDHTNLPRKDMQQLDEDITSFFLGYKILKEINKHQPFIKKFKTIKNGLEDHWSDNKQIYFRNPLFTLLIIFSDKDNVHKRDIITKFKKTRECALLSILFMILEENEMVSDLNELYSSFFKKAKTKYYSIPDSEKIYVAWILWKYKYTSKKEIKEVREMVSNYIKMMDWAIDEIKEGNLNLRASIYYDLLSSFEKNTRIASEEVPRAYNVLGLFTGISLLLLAVYVFSKMAYFHHDGFTIYTILNVILAIFSVLSGTMGYFLIREVYINSIYNDEELKIKLNKLILDNVIKAFIIGAICFGVLISYI